MTVGAFAALAAAGRGDAETDRGYTMDDWASMGWRRPMLGVAMTFFLFSLAGLPPTGGFFGKYLVFKAAVESDQWLLAIVGMLNATVAVYYYLRVVVTMYMSSPETDEQPLPISPATATVMVVSAIAVLYLGLAPSGLLELIQSIGTSLV
jgi:NADH-quinone oxidoreductase subunit N